MSVNDWSDEITSLDHLPAKLWHRANLPPTRSVPLTPLLVGTSADPRVACTARLHRPEPWTADRLSLRRREEERHSKKVKETSKNHVVVKRRFPPVPMSASVPGAMLGVTATKSVPGTGRGSARRTCSVRTRLTPTSQVAAFGAIGTATTKTGARFGHHPKFHRPHLAFTARRFIRPAAAKAEDLPVSFLDDEQWNDVVANANSSEGGDDEDGAAMASNSDYAAGESNLEYDRSFAVWICMAVSAVVYSVPFGFVRWNLSSLAPLVWWQLGLSTAVGTAMAMPLIAAITKPAATHDVNFPIFARASFGVRGTCWAFPKSRTTVFPIQD